MVALIWLPLGLTALLAAGSLPRRHRRWTRYTPVAASVVVLAAGVALVVLTRSTPALTTGGGVLRVDALSAYMLAVVGLVALTATWAGLPAGAGPQEGMYAALLCLFLAAMTLALMADNLGVMWVAVEATTITTAFLVGHHGDRRALEAAWKYVVLGSVGVSIAFLGIVLIYAATTAGAAPTLSWVLLAHTAEPLDHDLIRVGAALAALGFATKAGLAPMHSWLPDAHSQAPAAVSALMSGVLLSVAFYAILRIQAISDAVLGPALMRGMLLVGGLLSLVVAAALTLTQKDVKRMLAYSSIEHMGLLALGAAVGGPLAIGAVLLHILGHGLAKASIFVVAGRILSVEGTTRIDGIRGLLSRQPRLAIPFLTAMSALLGFPPSALFFTEVAIVVAGWQRGLGWAMGVALSLLLLIFAGLARHTLSMTLGGARGAAPEASPAPRPAGALLPLALALALVGVAGFLATPLRDVIARAVAAIGGHLMSGGPTLVKEVTREDLVVQAGALLGSRWRLALVAAHEDPHEFRVVYTFLRPADPPYEMWVRVPADDAWVPTLAGVSFSGGRFEREVRDLYGIAPQGHPLPRRLVRHGHWPAGYYPMLRGADAHPRFAEDVGSYPFVQVGGGGVYEIPVGPVHAGLIEPGHFRFSVVGETIVRLKARLWFLHRGVEKLFEGRMPQDGIELAERISGDTAVGHTLAYAMAVEEAAGLAVTPDVRAARALLLELERLHNHVSDIGAIVNDVGYSIVHMHTQHLREQLLRHNKHVTGHRLLRGAITIGGTRFVGEPDLDLVRDASTRAAELVAIALDNSGVLDRLTGTAVLDTEQARLLGTLGYVARASGLRTDARLDHPFLPLPELDGGFAPATQDTGDVLARFLVRAEEVTTSAALVAALAAAARRRPSHPNDLGDLGGRQVPLPLAAADGESGPTRHGLGVVEAWRGTLVHRVELAPDGTLSRVKVVDPSFVNWPAVPVALAETIVPDFPLANKSFNQSYAGNDL